MFEKRVIPGKTYCVTAYCPIVVSSVLNNTEVILVDTSEPGQYFFVAPTTAISSSISPNYILEVKGGGAGDSGNSGSGNGVGISFEKVADFDSLPETGKLGTIYLVPTEDTDNQWTEYVYIDGRYEIIGSKDFTSPDLENYAKLGANNIFTGNTNTFNGSVNATGINATDAAISNSLTADSITASSVLATTDATIDGSLIITGELITDGTGKDFQEILDTHIDDNTKHVSAESIQEVVPMSWGTWTTAPTSSGSYSFAIGSAANAAGDHSFIIGGSGYTQTCAVGFGHSTNASSYSIAIGESAKANKKTTITIGAQFTDTSGSYTCTTQGSGSITIGAGANTLNNGDTESSNSVTIGCKASNTGADSVVIGAQASGGMKQVVIGAGANAYYAGSAQVVLGCGAKGLSEGSTVINGASAFSHAVAIGLGSNARGTKSIALGDYTTASAQQSTAIGSSASAADRGVVVFCSVAEGGTKTQLYFSGANTPLANTYHSGAPMLGYVTKDSAGNIVAAGTRSLIDLLTDNSTFAPASLDENGEWVMPKVFHPSDLDMPQEEPAEPQEYQPLPVYPIVEPEIEEPIN